MDKDEARDWVTVYVTVGNSDDRLSQSRWADFTEAVGYVVLDYEVEVYGPWFTPSDSSRQSACWGVEVERQALVGFRSELDLLRQQFGQDTIAFAVAELEMIGGQ
jgi:hypothetical protein